MATSNKDMNSLMRGQAKAMAEAPYAGPSGMKLNDVAEDEPKPKESESKAYKVAAPGEPSTGEQFEYEPMTDIPGAWLVYPPGVICDDTEYRITMDQPATADDFAGMQQALYDAGAENPDLTLDTGVGLEA